MIRQIKTTLGTALIALVATVGVAHAKQSAAQQQASAKTAFAKLVASWQAAIKPGPMSASKCSSLAKSFDDFSDENKVPEGYFNAGVLLESCGQIKDAQAAYRDALKVNSRFAPAMVNLGEIAYRAGDVQAAQEQFDAALAADPKNAQAYTDTALLLLERARQTGDRASMKEVESKLRRALAVDASDSAAYALLALLYYTIAETEPSKLDLAELVIDRGKDVNKEYAPLYNVLGLIKLRRKKVTAALQEFKTAVQYDPRFIEAQLNIGAITLNARDYKTAEGAFKAALDARPTNPQQAFDATVGMGVALRGQRRIDEAEQWYNKAKQLNPRDCSVAYNLGVLYQDYKGNPDTDLPKAKSFFGDFSSCQRAESDKVKDASRRMKDIDDTFKALAEQKKLEEENKKLQEEADRMQKQQEQQSQTPPPGGAAAPGPGGAPESPAANAPPSTGGKNPASAPRGSGKK